MKPLYLFRILEQICIAVKFEALDKGFIFIEDFFYFCRKVMIRNSLLIKEGQYDHD